MYKDRLLSVGITANLKGFVFINEALKMYDPLQTIAHIYKTIAEIHNVSWQSVERCIRHAISKTGDYKTNTEWLSEMKILWDRQDEKVEDTPIGWICPSCGLVHSPSTSSCWCTVNREDVVCHGDDTLLNEHGKYVLGFAKNHGLTIAEAHEQPMVKAHLEYYNSTLDQQTMLPPYFNFATD